ncbi:MAG: hypothetical protein EPN47_20480 [Acidobacteria bacterium]|nr:MAG: hypothetical protein EPN47_20480 [Acidobacteriota bacterium]
MDFLTANHSSYPRIGSNRSEQVLRRTMTQRDRGEKADADVRAAEDHMVLLALQEQEEAGLDIVTDGLTRWNDPVSHLASKLEGARINGLLRYFDTNFYFRQPTISRKIKRTRALVVGEFQQATKRTAKPVKPILTGPCTLARLSLQDRVAAGPASLTLAFADVLSAEVADLAAAGARMIQIDEPCLLKYPGDLPLGGEALAMIADRKGQAELMLATYFGDAAPVYTELQRLPVDALILDLIYGPNLPSVIEAEGSAKPLGFGLLDGRNTKLEEMKRVAHTVERMLARVTAERCYLTTSCGLEYLPRDRARLKLKHLTSIRNCIMGES